MLELASGTINVLEKKVFDRLDRERMLKAPDYGTAFSVLFDTDLGEIASEHKDIERILEKDMVNLKNVLSRLLGEKEELPCLLFLKFDAVNLKIFLKRHLKKEEVSDIEPFSFAVALPEKMGRVVERVLSTASSKALSNRDKNIVSEINSFVSKMIELSIEDLTQPLAEVSSERIETAVDKAYFKVKIELAQRTHYFLADITRMEIDISNIKSLLQQRKNGRKLEFISGGNLQLEELKKLLELKEGEIFQDLKRFFEVFGLSLLIEEFAKEKSKTLLETQLKSFLSRKVFEKAKETGVGVEKILAFFQKKINAQANIRLILFSKRNNLSFKEIEKNLLPL